MYTAAVVSGTIGILCLCGAFTKKNPTPPAWRPEDVVSNVESFDQKGGVTAWLVVDRTEESGLDADRNVHAGHRVGLDWT